MSPSSIPSLPLGAVLRVLAPGSPQARAIFDLGIVAIIIFAAIFVIVAGIIAVGALNPLGLRAALLAVGLADLLALTVYVCKGWILSGVGVVGLFDLLRVPVFLFWKLLVICIHPKPSTWIRTKRER